MSFWIAITFLATGLLLSGVLHGEIFKRIFNTVNAAAKAGEEETIYGFWPGKYDRIINEYKALRPESRLPVYCLLTKICALILFFPMAFALFNHFSSH